MKNRITPELIVELNPNEIFVFGSNQSGIHGAGAARTAFKWGAKHGHPFGLYGKTFAIPTKNATITKSLRVDEIRSYVEVFISFAKHNPDLTFLVTEIGCGLAGYTPSQIAPLFSEAIEIPNIHLPKRFWDVLKIKREVKPIKKIITVSKNENSI